MTFPAPNPDADEAALCTAKDISSLIPVLISTSGFVRRVSSYYETKPYKFNQLSSFAVLVDLKNVS